MNKTQWRTLYSRMRKDAMKSPIAGIAHNGIDFTMTVHIAEGMRLRPSIIRHRSKLYRITEALAWAKHYREEARNHKRNGSYFARHAIGSMNAHWACILEARGIRELL